jgi:3-oxoacyl-[acyl-carrier-protein] synthase-3
MPPLIEKIDYIIFAHNFGDVKSGTNQSDMLPSLATRVKNKLQLKNPKCVAYDNLFGCPGIEGVLQGTLPTSSREWHNDVQ